MRYLLLLVVLAGCAPSPRDDRNVGPLCRHALEKAKNARDTIIVFELDTTCFRLYVADRAVVVRDSLAAAPKDTLPEKPDSAAKAPR
jgi:hypothetical protein